MAPLARQQSSAAPGTAGCHFFKVSAFAEGTGTIVVGHVEDAGHVDDDGVGERHPALDLRCNAKVCANAKHPSLVRKRALTVHLHRQLSSCGFGYLEANDAAHHRDWLASARFFAALSGEDMMRAALSFAVRASHFERMSCQKNLLARFKEQFSIGKLSP